MIRKFLMRKLMKRKLKQAGMPEGQQEQIVEAVNKNPDLFKKIADEVKAKTKEGMDEQYASLQVMKKYEKELRELMGQ